MRSSPLWFGTTPDGAAVATGSRYLLTCGQCRVLIDCGLFQGYKHLRLKNWSRLPFAAEAVILFSGFQAGGTRGAALVAGASQLRIHGESFPVRAEVAQLQSASAHADAIELIAWARQMPAAPRRVFVTHGEPGASDALRHRIQTELGWSAAVPEYRDEVEL